MRSDMAKVLVERPRGGGGYYNSKGYRKETQRTSQEDLPSREGIKARCRGGRKYLRDHLGPLRRFLLSNVGRPWNLIYSEICQELRNRFPVREHFLVHVYQYVQKDVILIHGVPCHSHGYASGKPLMNYAGRHLYVCPKSGLLRKVPDPRRKKR